MADSNTAVNTGNTTAPRQATGQRVPAVRKTAETKAEAAARLKQEKLERKNKHKLRRVIIWTIVIFILAALIGTFIYLSVTMDLLGTRTWFITQVLRLDPSYQSVAQLSSLLDQREKELNQRQSDLEDEIEKFNKRVSDLDKREVSLDEREIALTEREYIFDAPMSDENIEDMRTLGRIYAAMDAESAASILLRLYNIEETAAILYYMPVKSSSAILAAMDPDRAARITEILLLE